MKRLLLLVLLVLSIFDIKYKKIPVCIPIGGSILIFLIRFLGKKAVWPFLLSGLCVCFFFLLAGWFTKGQIGSGDAFVFMMVGMELGGVKCIGLIYLSFFFAFLAAVFFFFVKKKGRYDTLPFVPFISLAYLVLFLESYWKNL